MRIDHVIHEHVGTDGVVPAGGSVGVRPAIRMSRGEGCGLPDCHCSDGYWIMIAGGREADETVHVLVVHFNDEIEMDKFFEKHEMVMK